MKNHNVQYSTHVRSIGNNNYLVLPCLYYYLVDLGCDQDIAMYLVKFFDSISDIIYKSYFVNKWFSYSNVFSNTDEVLLKTGWVGYFIINSYSSLLLGINHSKMAIMMEIVTNIKNNGSFEYSTSISLNSNSNFGVFFNFELANKTKAYNIRNDIKDLVSNHYQKFKVIDIKTLKFQIESCLVNHVGDNFKTTLKFDIR